MCVQHLTHLEKNKLFKTTQRCTALAVQRFFMLQIGHHNKLMINGKNPARQKLWD